jgi:protein SCO1/2
MQRLGLFRRVSLAQRTHEGVNLRKLLQNRRLCTPAPATGTPKAEKVEKAAALASRGPITFLSLAIAGIALGAILVYYKSEKEKKTQRVASVVKTTGKAAIGGPWVLVDKEGIPRTDAHYKGKGKFQILYFGFTFCPDICPSELVKIGKVLDILDKKGMCPCRTLNADAI